MTNNEQATDFAGTIRHELGHALGIVFDHYKKNGQEIIDEDIADTRSWTMHIVDQNGNPARPGLPIVTSAKATDPNRSFVVDDSKSRSNRRSQKSSPVRYGCRYLQCQ